MSKHAKKDRKPVPVPPLASEKSVAARAGMLLAIAIAVGAAIWWVKFRPQEPPALGQPAVEAGGASQPAVGAASQPAVAAVARPEFQRLKGRWLRPDGGYIIDVKNVDESGRMDISYFNPRSIHVARAEASQDGAVTKVFIELRDVNYPGSTYNLTYDPQDDRLEGIYYQAALQQSFDVFFLRMK
jgi:hypothetical protein